ncbi:MAG: hydrogenase maturation nickel metallochaperone HypA [Candidatus Alcyoniella australis]|nr:hydrogenase maturation nickel metallochaperone HypA [Candidatus Alcyoniella australis]
MHELPVVRSIFEIVIEHARVNSAVRVVKINLRIGALTDLVDQWVERYFEMLAQGSIAQGAKIEIERPPGLMRCRQCDAQWNYDRQSIGAPCPQCGSRESAIVTGREYTVESIAIE